MGRLTSNTYPNGSTQYTYDAQGRILTDLQRVSATPGANSAQIAKTVGYGYSNGQLTSITYPSGRKLGITYAGGQPTTYALAKDASSTPVTLISQLAFEPFGGPKGWRWQLGTATPASTQSNDKVYDTSGRLVRYRMGNTIRDLTYDAADRISAYTHYDATTAQAQASLNQGFGYDKNGRLTGITTATASWTITYDANGNRTGVSQNGTSSTYTTPGTSNKLTSTTNPARSFGYDAAGNTISDSAPVSGGYTATYDASGRVATVTKAGITTTYSYNVQGQRVRKFSSSGASSTTVFVYDLQGQLMGEYDSAGNALREYVWLGSTPIAMFTPNGANNPLVYYIHTDHLDTPRLVTDTANNIRWRWLAEPFGTTAPETNPSNLGGFTQNLRFPGQYADSESGLSYNYFRDYDSTTGRYVQSDPIGLGGGINTYAYVGGKPLSYVDPRGLWEVAIEFYRLFGGGISFGRDPQTNQGFLTCKIGVGYGGGAGYDPLAGRPGGANAAPGAGGVTLGVSGSAGGALGVAGLGISGQIDGSRGYDFGAGRQYNDPSFKGSIGYEPGGRTGAGIGGSFTIQGGIYGGSRP